MLYVFTHGQQGEIFVQKARTAIEVLVNALTKMFGVPNHPVDVIGTRHGEKLFEVLSREEMVTAKDQNGYFEFQLICGFEPEVCRARRDQISESVEYNSHNTTRLM